MTGEAPITMMPNMAMGALISASMATSLDGRLARIGAVTIQNAGLRANPTTTNAAQRTSPRRRVGVHDDGAHPGKPRRGQQQADAHRGPGVWSVRLGPCWPHFPTSFADEVPLLERVRV